MTLATWVQVAPISLPRLRRGANRCRYRSFDAMEEYRRWCEDNLPDWLGYGRV